MFSTWLATRSAPRSSEIVSVSRHGNGHSWGGTPSLLSSATTLPGPGPWPRSANGRARAKPWMALPSGPVGSWISRSRKVKRPPSIRPGYGKSGAEPKRVGRSRSVAASGAEASTSTSRPPTRVRKRCTFAPTSRTTLASEPVAGSRRTAVRRPSICSIVVVGASGTAGTSLVGCRILELPPPKIALAAG